MAEKVKQKHVPRGGLGLPARASYAVGKTQRQRAAQRSQQMRVLVGIIAAAVVLGLIAAYVSWQGAGSTKSVSCDDYPEYCVPLVGGGSEVALEAEDARTLDGESTAAPGVVRGVTEEGMPFIGNPDAPIQIVELADYACSHCQDYHESDLPRIIDDFVLTGQAQFQVGLLTGTGGAYSQLASQAALCAGEQGAFWEMHDELYRLAMSQGVTSAFTAGNLVDTAGDMGLDERELRQCLSSNKYLVTLNENVQFANDHGVTGTPSVLVNFGEGWRMVNRDYNTIADLVDRASAE